MPDITLCKDDKCHLKNKCYLFMAIPNQQNQSYFLQTPRKDYECDYFRPIQIGTRIKDLDNG